MRPIPKCDLVPEYLQGRPWWGTSSIGFQRRDGESILCKDQDHEPLMVEEVRERIDRAKPIPAPPLRAGQVWLLEFEGQYSTLLVGGSGFPIGPVSPYNGGCFADLFTGVMSMSGPAKQAPAKAAPDQVSKLAEGALYVSYFPVDSHGKGRCYLLVDPVDPGCAPWSAP